jgi:hypothetical protein
MPTAESPLDGARAFRAFAGRRWPVFPVRFNPDPLARKYPLTAHGMNDATVDEQVIRGWLDRWPNAVPAIVTGKPSGVVALDIDIRPHGSGFDSLDALGVSVHPTAPTAHTPQGGCAVLFRWPGHFVKTCSSMLGPHLDIRGDRGSVILPPGPGRFWDPHLGPDTPLPPMPAWMVIAEPERSASAEPVKPTSGLSPYAESALENACSRIAAAAPGEQEATLNSEAFSIGRLAGAGGIPADFARRVLVWAARKIRDHDQRRPWRAREIQAKVVRAFDQGMQRPRGARRA